MAPPPLKKEPSHFEVLDLTPTSLDGQDVTTQTKTVKQAYRRALLKHHPDKNQQAKAQEAPSGPSLKQKNNEQHFTVDQITEAYTVLSDVRQRREYVTSLRTQTGHFSSSSSPGQKRGAGSSANASQNYNYHKTFNFKSTAAPQAASGVETKDLDDLAWDGRKRVYYQTCGRCGTERGYCFRELDLDEVGEDGELMVQCIGCSLWLRVLFDEAEDEDEVEHQQNGSTDVKQRSNTHGEDLKQTRSGSSSGKSGGWSWKFNFGISIGGAASASASAGRE